MIQQIPTVKTSDHIPSSSLRSCTAQLYRHAQGLGVGPRLRAWHEQGTTRERSARRSDRSSTSRTPTTAGIPPATQFYAQYSAQATHGISNAKTNVALITKAREVLELERAKCGVDFIHVKGHSADEGNNQASCSSARALGQGDGTIACSRTEETRDEVASPGHGGGQLGTGQLGHQRPHAWSPSGGRHGGGHTRPSISTFFTFIDGKQHHQHQYV